MRAVTALIVAALCCIWTTMPHTASAFVRGSSWHHQLQAGTRALSQKVRRGAHPCRARGPTWRGPTNLGEFLSDIAGIAAGDDQQR